MPESEDGRIGLKVGNLQACARIGYGGMGAVYLARHRLLEEALPSRCSILDFREDPNEVSRFRKEAIAAARLRHPNIVFVTDFGFDERLGLYLVMEHLEGQSLAAVLKTIGQKCHSDDVFTSLDRWQRPSKAHMGLRSHTVTSSQRTSCY